MTQPTPTDGRSPEWAPDGVPLALWLAVIAHGPMTGPDVGRLRMALDTLHEADELLTLARSGTMADRDTLAAYAGARAARKAASDLVAELTGTKRGPGRPAKTAGQAHDRRPSRQRDATRRPATHAQDIGEDDE